MKKAIHYLLILLFSWSFLYGQPEAADSTGEKLINLGYTSQKNNQWAGAVTSIQSQDFADGMITDPMQLVRGKVPGFSVFRAGGDPNEAFELRVRGLNSVESSTDPLFVIDGFPAADYHSIDPEDIERITILRGAAAAAIYGIRAANGVILIETKTGEAGKFSLNYHTQLISSSASNQADMLTADEFNEFRNRVNNASGFPTIGDFGDADTDWQKEIRRNHTFSQVHHLAGSGGSQHTQYRVAMTLRDINGVVQKSGYNQLNLHANINQSLWKERLKIGLQGVFNRRRTEDFNYDFFDENGFQRINHINAPLFYAARMIPEMPVNDPNSSMYGGFFQPFIYEMQNPVAILDQVTNENTLRNSMFQTRASVEIIKGLTLNGSFALQQRGIDKGYQSEAVAYNFNGTGYTALQTEKDFRRFYDLHLDYQTSIGKHHLSAVLGHSYEYNRQILRKATLNSFLGEESAYLDLASDSVFANNLNADIVYHRQSRRMSAFFGVLNYQLEDKISAQFSLRREGASNLGANQKWGLFPAGSLSANWLALLNREGLFRTRFSYGLTGNLPRDNYRSQFLVSGVGYTFFDNGQYIEAQDIVRQGNPDLSFEKTRGWNLGFDIGIKEDFLNISVDFFGQKTTDLVQNLNLPFGGVAIYRSFTFNAGELNSSGVELSITNQLFKDNPEFSMTNRLVLGRSRTWLVTLDSEYREYREKRMIGDQSNGPGRWIPVIYLRERKPVGEFWGFVYERIDTDGRWVFQDLDGGGFDYNEDEFAYHGSALPQFIWSWNSVLEWKKWSVDFQLTGVSGHHMFNTYRYYYEIPSSMVGQNILYSATINPANRLRDYGELSDFYIEKASYARLDYLTLAYQFDTKDKWYSDLQLYLTSQNLFTITGYSGVDPEPRLNSRGAPLVPGVELRNTYFPVRNWVLGLRLNL
jgi:TonB-linked SusC/RagA family outer membrane protein